MGDNFVNSSRHLGFVEQKKGLGLQTCVLKTCWRVLKTCFAHFWNLRPQQRKQREKEKQEDVRGKVHCKSWQQPKVRGRKRAERMSNQCSSLFFFWMEITQMQSLAPRKRQNHNPESHLLVLNTALSNASAYNEI